MYRGQTFFSQIMQYLPWKAFSQIVARYDGDRHVRSLSYAQRFRAIAFAQLTGCNSLGALTACLGGVPAKLYHAGFTASVRVSTVADLAEFDRKRKGKTLSNKEWVRQANWPRSGGGSPLWQR